MSAKTVAEKLREAAKHAREERGLPVYTPDQLEKLADDIEREYLPRPRFEDGEPVKIGDKFENHFGKSEYIAEIQWIPNMRYALKSESGHYAYKAGERVKRPEPEVLDADGVPIKVGDTVYFVGGAEHFDVLGIESNGDVHIGREDGTSTDAWAAPSDLTHKKPDSLERIEEDAKLDTCAYFGHDQSSCDGCRMAKKAKLPCEAEKALDLLRRQRELLVRE